MAGFTQNFNKGVQMSIVEKEKAIRKINERYTDIVRQFGKNSGIAKNYRNKMESVFGADNMHKAKSRKTSGTKRRESAADLGIELASRNKEVINKVSDEELDALLSHHTAGEIKRAVREYAKEESRYSEATGGGPVTESDILEAMDYIYDLEQDDDSDLYEAYKLYWESVGGAGTGAGRPDYILLMDTVKDVKAMNEAYDHHDDEEGAAIEDQIKNRLDMHNRFKAGDDYFGGI